MASFKWPIVFYFNVSKIALSPNKHFDNAVFAFGEIGCEVEVGFHVLKRGLRAFT